MRNLIRPILGFKRQASCLKIVLFMCVLCIVWKLIRRLDYYPAVPVSTRKTDKFLTKFPTYPWKPARIKKILLWTKWFRVWGWLEEAQRVLPGCSKKCAVTNSRQELNSSDAILFHCEDIWKYRRSLFSTVYNELNELPPYRDQSQVWVFWSMEPVSHTYGVLPDDMFNWTAHYRRDSTIFMPYDRFVKKTKDEINTNDLTAHEKLDYFREKTKMAVIVESNCKDQSKRYRLIGEISKYIDVDQFGECSNNVICRKDRGLEECDKLITHYKFYLAFENSVCQDYVTEKFWRSVLIRHQIPVIAVSNATAELLPSGSYLNVFDFNSVKELTDKMKEIANNATVYNSYFKWISYYKRDEEHAFCKLCSALHENRSAQVYHDLEGWTKHDNCAKLSVSN